VSLVLYIFLAPLTLMHSVLCLWQWASTQSQVPKKFLFMGNFRQCSLLSSREIIMGYIELIYLGSSSMEIGHVPEIWRLFWLLDLTLDRSCLLIIFFTSSYHWWWYLNFLWIRNPLKIEIFFESGICWRSKMKQTE
jgi:hypothetical protein